MRSYLVRDCINKMTGILDTLKLILLIVMVGVILWVITKIWLIMVTVIFICLVIGALLDWLEK